MHPAEYHLKMLETIGPRTIAEENEGLYEREDRIRSVAPELLQAVKDLLAEGDADEFYDHGDCGDCAFCKARRVVAKAEGR